MQREINLEQAVMSDDENRRSITVEFNEERLAELDKVCAELQLSREEFSRIAIKAVISGDLKLDLKKPGQ